MYSAFSKASVAIDINVFLSIPVSFSKFITISFFVGS